MTSNPEVRIEVVAEGNLAVAAELALKLWPGSTYAEEYDEALKALKAHDRQSLLALVAEQFAGFIQLSIRTDYVEGASTSPVLYLEGIYVEPAWRRQGIARRLLRSAEAWGLERGCVEMASDAELQNTPGIAFHMAVGFSEANRVVCFTRPIIW